MAGQRIERHLLRGRDLADRSYTGPIGVTDMAVAASLSVGHFTRAFKEKFGVSPHGYLLTRRLERAAALLRNTDHRVADGPWALRKPFDMRDDWTRASSAGRPGVDSHAV